MPSAEFARLDNLGAYRRECVKLPLILLCGRGDAGLNGETGNLGASEANAAIWRLVQALQHRGLETTLYEDQGVPHVRVSPLFSPAAGANLHVGDEEQIVTEWDTSLGNDPSIAARTILGWFGKDGGPSAPRARP